MPEFEESDSQPKPEHNYTPSTSTPKKTGGRRRSGGFKSEATASNSKIGEVDPTEALKVETQKSASRSDNTPETKASCSIKNSKPSRSSCNFDNTKKSTGAKPQPSEATLDSIREVEERIAKVRAESEKNRPERDRRSSKKHGAPIHKKGRKAAKGGLLAMIGQFFGKLFGSSPQNSSTGDQERPPQRRNPRSNDQRRSGGHRKNDSEKRYKSHRKGSNHHRKNASQNT